MSPAVARKPISDGLHARLLTLTGVTIYRGETGAGCCDGDKVGDPPVVVTGGAPDASGRVGPYVVLHAGTGAPYVNGERDVADTHDDLSAIHQITCVHGFEADCLHLVDRVDALMRRWSPSLDGHAFGRLTPPPGYDPGPPRPDDTLKGLPRRFFVPLQYRLDATT